MATYITKAGDTVDYIAWKFYGFQDRQTVEQVLAANHGLAEYGAALPPNVRVEMPELVKPSVTPGVKLWD